jgi:plasmid stabilization system protein ParE
MDDYIVSPQANDDIFLIWCYLAERASVETANRVESKICEAFESLSRNPGKGHKRSDLTSHSVLFFTVYSYMIVYRSEAPIEIVRVLHGRRNVRLLLESSSSGEATS